MAWTEVPAFLPTIGESVAAQALRFLILSASRTGEVIGARWSEVNWEEKLWIIPASRMKANREHKVPLTDEAIAVLEVMRDLSPKFIFPGNKPNSGISNMAMTQLLRRLGRGDVTVHGFRSSFRDWAAEKGNMPREIAELCLAHEVGNEVERAYRRSDLIEKRLILLRRWAMFCNQRSNNIVHMKAQ